MRNIQLLSDRYINDIREHAGEALRFNVQLSFPGNRLHLDKQTVLKICELVVQPLLAASEEVYVYGQENTNAFRDFAKNVEKSRGKLRVLKDKNVISGYEAYWGADCNERGTVLFITNCTDQSLGVLFEQTQDPGFLGNLSTIASTSAIRNAKKTVASCTEKICFLLSANQGLTDLYIFAHSQRIKRCLDIAFERCSYTDRFLNLYGR